MALGHYKFQVQPAEVVRVRLQPMIDCICLRISEDKTNPVAEFIGGVPGLLDDLPQGHAKLADGGVSIGDTAIGINSSVNEHRERSRCPVSELASYNFV